MLGFYSLCTSIFISTMLLFDFNENTELTNWYVVDDVVMGGRSSGRLYVDENGHGVFKGSVSLENNGGFSSIRYVMPAIDLSLYRKVKIRLKGDGNTYQFRVKNKRYDRYSYITYFDTDGDWENITIELSNLYPSFRGRKLSLPNFEGNQISEVAILIGNKKPQDFKLVIDEISLE